MSSRSNRLKFLAFSCPHCPLEDKIAVEWMVGQIEEHRPDLIVHLGDGLEADSASRWPSEYTWSLQDEFEAHERLLMYIRSVSPDSRKVFLPGNHEDNLLALNRIDRKLRSLCDYRNPSHSPELMEFWEQPCRYEFSPGGAFRVGQVTFAHGYKTGANSDELQSIMLGMPNGLFISGHTHRPLPVTQARKGQALLPYWFANAGTLRDMWDVPYMQRKNRFKWGQAVVVGELDPNASSVAQVRWEAELRIFRMFEDRWSTEAAGDAAGAVTEVPAQWQTYCTTAPASSFSRRTSTGSLTPSRSSSSRPEVPTTSSTRPTTTLTTSRVAQLESPRRRSRAKRPPAASQTAQTRRSLPSRPARRSVPFCSTKTRARSRQAH